MDIKKEINEEIQGITSDIKSFVPDNILEIILDYSFSIIFAITIFVVGRFISLQLVNLVKKALYKSGVEKTLVKFVANIVYYILLIVVILASLSKIGIETTSFIAILGAAGLAIALSLKDSLKNFASGVMIILFKPFKVRDSVIAGGVTGTVVDVNIFNTVLLTADNQTIIIPNSSITSSIITNINANSARRIDITVGISYEDSIQKAKDTLLEIVNSNPKVLKEKAVGINVTKLGDFSVDITINVWVNTSDYGSTRSWLLENIKTTFDEVGISIPYPKQDVYQYRKN